MLNWLQGAVEKFREFAYADTPQLRPRLGLALAGGFARGIAHIGVLKVFRENQIPIDYLAGTSVGALIAAAYAGGVTIEQMKRLASSTQFSDFGRWTLSWMGLATNERLERYLRRYTSVTSFDELGIPVAISATDLSTGEAVYFTKGLLGPALRASCAYPGLFLPVRHDGRTLVDGFLASPVPVDILKSMGAQRIIAVYLESSTDDLPRNAAGVLSRSFSIIQRYAHPWWRDKADLVIEPDVKGYIWDDFGRTDEMVAAGETAARAMLPKIRALLEPTRSTAVATEKQAPS